MEAASQPGRFWAALEAIPGQCALPAVWRERLGPEFETCRATLLQRRPGDLADSVPCPRGCGCWHEVVIHADGVRVGICTCESWNCDDLPLAESDLTPLELNWQRLARGLGETLDFRVLLASTGLPDTRQIGFRPESGTPVFMTIPLNAEACSQTVSGLTIRLRQPFILLTPTSAHLSPAARELLADGPSIAVALDSALVLGRGGRWEPRRPPARLFEGLASREKAGDDEDAARRAFALIQQLETGGREKPPLPITVFRLYCIDQMPAIRIAKACNCAKTTVLRRLQAIEKKTGQEVDELRRLAANFENLAAEVRDSRAHHIRSGALLDEDESDR